MRKKGFTALELVIILAVIVALIGIAIPSFMSMREESQKTQAEGDLRVLKIACESYYRSTGTYPDESIAWQHKLVNTSRPIIDKVLIDPFTKAPYKYDVSNNGRYFIVYSVGPGGEGNAAIANDGTVTLSKNIIWESNSRNARQ
ncbi:MAG: prepilin-type N-terminal cleavage/methylation domain-containing protein [Candidatus Margulisbacteria bacterium]|nr:prepilin-type N-terminal cleavage/methylation domain-containing protein [Candidatus Margulisiibacteriota bacterium]MBU1021168.1 prepilin-type N-terminal cleavage/methylation domain-containing protein [Candidatus Margulisiibacteriota bacterium]MBU1729774.1 prepilin-type N-terminal cleavage/methylation domain-containing protein [Candidatus Margulisiibacteriota bacterium]MBU1955275.1 prepilin-type N-terminal cleavage/methylation domain-containing protein [Candidatus Margulisiibacteriota bacteriu